MQELNFSQFQKQYLDTLEPGDIAMHGQLHPGPYPSDIAQHEQIKASGCPPQHTERPPFFDLLQKYKDRGIQVNRLRVLPNPGWNGYSKADALALVQTFNTEQNQLENIRLAWFGQQVARLLHSCGEENEVVKSYQNGVETGSPKASFWSIRKKGEFAVRTVAFMDYRNQDFAPLRVYSPVSHVDHSRYEHFWKDVFNDPAQSFDLPTALKTIPTLRS